VIQIDVSTINITLGPERRGVRNVQEVPAAHASEFPHFGYWFRIGFGIGLFGVFGVYGFGFEFGIGTNGIRQYLCPHIHKLDPSQRHPAAASSSSSPHSGLVKWFEDIFRWHRGFAAWVACPGFLLCCERSSLRREIFER